MGKNTKNYNVYYQKKAKYTVLKSTFYLTQPKVWPVVTGIMIGHITEKRPTYVESMYSVNSTYNSTFFVGIEGSIFLRKLRGIVRSYKLLIHKLT